MPLSSTAGFVILAKASIQWPAILVMADSSDYWIVRSSRTMTRGVGVAIA